MPASRWSDHVPSGDHASRPAASDTAVGILYACSTHGKIYQSDGVGTWSDWHVPEIDPVEAVVTAAGDLIFGTGPGAVDNLPVGPDGKILGVASGLPVWVDPDTSASVALAAHIADATDAHDASAISVVPFGTIAATDVQAALAEVMAEASAGASLTAEDVRDTIGAAMVGTAPVTVTPNDAGDTITVAVVGTTIVRVNHGSTASTARPHAGDPPVLWVGTVTPTNADTTRDFGSGF